MYNPTEPCQLIVLDLETRDKGRAAKIYQLSAVTRNGHTYSSYVLPKSNVSFGASRVNNLAVENYINGSRFLCKNSLPVVADSLAKALSSFSNFIKQHCCINGKRFIPAFIGHNAAVLMFPYFYVMLENHTMIDDLKSVNVHFGESLPF